MSTIRRGVRPADQFVMVTNQFARDRRLSLAARGLGLWLLSHADGWEITTTEIAKAEGIGRDKIRGYLGELQAAGYLIRERERLANGRMGGMLYQIFCTPQEQENPRPDLRLEGQALADQAPVSGQHKKTTSKKTTPKQKTTPSGGSSAAAATPSLELSPIHEQRQEDAVAPPVETLTLFDTPTPIKAGKPKPPPEPSAGTVVAAFVDAYRQAHSAADPVRSAIGRVARDAKMLIESGRASATELEKAASEMGSGPYNNLPVALDKLREAPKRGRQGAVPASPYTDPYWQEAAARQEKAWHEQLLSDDEAIRWARRDPSEVARLIDTYPELSARFEAVA